MIWQTDSMAVQESCKQTLEISIPVAEVQEETERVVTSLAQRVRLPGFRPGKVPTGVIRARFTSDIREEVVKSLVPKFFQKRVEEEGLRVVGTPDITEVHFHAGEPLRFKVEFEVAPEIELKDYRGLTVPYRDPVITDEDVAKRLQELREQKAEFVNVDPRPLANGDYAVVSLDAINGLEEPLGRQEELVLHIGGEETLEAFSNELRGLSPGEEKEFDVLYPQDYGDEKLSGKKVHFRAKLKGIRLKELPELNDEFARDLGDFQTLEELREEVRKSLSLEREYLAQQEAQNRLVENLVDMHDFPIPEAFLERQIESQVGQYLRAMAARGVDPRSVKLDWEKLKQSQQEKAMRDVKATLLLDKIGDREGIEVTVEEVDREVQHIAKQEREPVAAVRQRLEKEGLLRRIASRVRTEKTLNFLFEHARKVADD
jgi:trigger factor